MSSSSTTRILFGSCNKPEWHTSLWDPIVARRPDLWIWGGDNIYADIPNGHELFPKPHTKFLPGSPTRLRHLYNMQLADPGYQRLLNSSVAIVGTWDDHDFGLDNSDETYPYRTESQAAFLDFIGEPVGSPRRTQKGVYTSQLFDFGNGLLPHRKVLVVLLDLRYNKDPYTTFDGDFLGEEQWDWLEWTLRDSVADVNLIVSSLQFLADRRILGHNVAGENWNRFEDKRTKFLHLLGRYNVSAPIFLSGDIHFAELSMGVSKAGNILEVTSSGMTHSWGTRPAVEGSSPLFDALESVAMRTALQVMPWRYQIDDRETGDFSGGQSHFTLQQNFGELEFDWDTQTLTTMIRGHQNKLLMSRNFSLVGLGLRGEDLSDFGPIGGAPSSVHVLASSMLLMSFMLVPMGILCFLAVRCCIAVSRRWKYSVQICDAFRAESDSESDDDHESLVPWKSQE